MKIWAAISFEANSLKPQALYGSLLPAWSQIMCLPLQLHINAGGHPNVGFAETLSKKSIFGKWTIDKVCIFWCIFVFRQYFGNCMTPWHILAALWRWLCLQLGRQFPSCQCYWHKEVVSLEHSSSSSPYTGQLDHIKAQHRSKSGSCAWHGHFYNTLHQ